MNANPDPQTDDRLSAYLDGELASDERAEFEQILRQRPDYQAALEGLERLRRELRALPDHALKSDLRQRVSQEIGRVASTRSSPQPVTPRGRGWVTPGKLTSALAVLAATCLLVILLPWRREAAEFTQVPQESVGKLVVPEVEPASPLAKAESLGEPRSPPTAGARVQSQSPDESRSGDEANRAMEPGEAPSAARRGGTSGLPPTALDHPDAPSSNAPTRQRFEIPGRLSPMDREPATRADDEDANEGGVADFQGDAADFSDLAMRESEILEIVIQPRSPRSYEHLMAAMAAALPQPSAEEPLPNLDLREIETLRESAATEELDESSPPKQVNAQVIEVTSTREEMWALIAAAQVEGALVKKSRDAEASQLVEVGTDQAFEYRRDRSTDDFRFGGTIQSWTQLPSVIVAGQAAAGPGEALPTEVLGRSAVVPSVPPPPHANHEGQESEPAAPPAADDRVIRWRITILPVR